jgi:hypothetical protein
MNETITNFLEAKKQAADLEGAARKEMQNEFNQLLNQAADLSDAYKKTFSGKLNVPTRVRFAVVGTAPKKRKSKAGEAPAPVEATNNANGKKIGGLKRSLVKAQEKLAGAKAAGADCKALEDRVYEIQDELRLLGVETVTAAPPAEQEAPAAAAAAASDDWLS